MVTFLGRGSRLAFPFQPRDRHGCRTRLSRPTCAPRVTSSRVDNLFEPRREIRGGDPPRIPPTARSLPGCSRDPWIRHPAEGVRHPRKVGPDRPSARVTSRSRTRTASARFFSRDTADTRLAEERFLDRRCALRRRLLAFLGCPRLASAFPPAKTNPPRGVLSSTHAAPEIGVTGERFANRGRSRVSPERNRARDHPDDTR